MEPFGPCLGVLGARLSGLRLDLKGLGASLRCLNPLLGLERPRFSLLRPLLGGRRGPLGHFGAGPRLFDPLVGMLPVGFGVARQHL